MVHRAEQQRQIIAVVGKRREVERVSLYDADRFAACELALQDLDVVPDQLDGGDRIAFPRKVTL